MHEWSFSDDNARDQYNHLPDDGRAALDELLRAVCLVPFNFVEQPDPKYQGHAGASKMLDFAEGRGMVTVQVVEAYLAVNVWSIQWLG